jgi:putative NIF3 family GTP cyclohydrolase 1 type 2
MRLETLYSRAVAWGLANDPRGKKNVYKLIRSKKATKGLAISPKLPYPDSMILRGDPQTDIKKVMIGIDIDGAEIVLADRLNEKGEGIDLVIAHHPAARAYAHFYEVMYMQADILAKFGLSLDVAKKFLEKRIKEVERRVMPANHNRVLDAARLLDIPFMCLHTVADNCVVTYLQTMLDRRRPAKLHQVVDLLSGIEEYAIAKRNNCGPRIICGKPSSRAGKIFVDMTGGTEGSKEIFGRLSQAGVTTIVCMHLSEEHFMKIKDENINVIIAGHISSDNLGLNLLLDHVDPDGELAVVECSGFTRIRRT